MQERIVISAYDLGWPEAFAHEQVALATACAGLSLTFEHIGSTSIPGLGAKPIVDIMGGFESGADLNVCIEAIVALGYEYVGRYEQGEDGMPFRRYFKKRGAPRSFNLHVVHRESNFWERQIAFRDHLRRDAATRDAYERLKRDLAPHFTDVNEYAIAKTDFVEGVLRMLHVAPRIRRIAAADGAILRSVRIAAISNAPDAFGSTLAETEATSADSWNEWARDRSAGNETVIYFAEDNAAPCGIVGGVREDDSLASLISMWVAPSHRRAGLGRTLVDTLVAWARQAGYTELELWVTESNFAAKALYAQAGFKPTDELQPHPSNAALCERMYRMTLSN